MEEVKKVEESNKVEVPLMSEEKFEKYISKILHLTHFEGINKFKSINRAIKRGNVSPEGIIYPRRPFNNRANTIDRKEANSRAFNELKKKIYARIKNSREGTA